MYRQVVNLKAAKALGITIPCSLLARAEEMIEWHGTPLTISDATVLVGNPVVNCRGGGIFGLHSQCPVVSGEQRSSTV